MVKVIAIFEKQMDVFITMLIFGCVGMAIYMLSSNEPPKKKVRSAFLGFFVAMAFSYPTYVFIGGGHLWALAAISSVYTICGQFLPEFLQSIAPKFVRKALKDKFGVDSDADNGNAN